LGQRESVERRGLPEPCHALRVQARARAARAPDRAGGERRAADPRSRRLPGCRHGAAAREAGVGGSAEPVAEGGPMAGAQDLEFARFLASLGVGGVIAGLLFMFYRKDVRSY